jgi:lysosomal Pro-X carboxypeptidase
LHRHQQSVQKRFVNLGNLYLQFYRKVSLITIFLNAQNIISCINLLDDGKEWLRTHWNLCVPLNGTDDVVNLKDWLTNVWTNLAMVNYPYAANFLAPLPAYPVKVYRHIPISILKNKRCVIYFHLQAVCEHLTNSSLDDHSLLDELFKGLSVYANFTGQTKCLDVSQQADQSLGDMGWDFQVKRITREI